jgi:diguanylate cyclase (GGDEF)-like protein/putative nucleotidyltransferase with HDIG domain
MDAPLAVDPRVADSTERRHTWATFSWPAKLYFLAVAAASIAAAAGPLSRLDTGTRGWTTFLALAASAGLAQIFVVRTIRDQSYPTSIVFLVAGALLLPPELVALLGVVQHVPEWLKYRYPWYIQTFNICNYTLNAMAAWRVAQLVQDGVPGISDDARYALAGAVACVVLVGLNHTLLAGMLYLAHGHRPKDTDLFSPVMLSTDTMLAAIGIGMAALWHTNIWLAPVVLAPVLLIHRSLHVPRLEEQARVDPKTGLFNARHFGAALTEELGRAERFERPASLIMADLDLLREVNNTYGHLAGDAVLASVAQVFRDQLRHYDIPARFGGEEFAILLPETDYDQALEIAERIRAAVAANWVEVETASEPIRATVSIGVATYPQDGRDPNELIHHADVAVYRAKLQGRNRVLGARSDSEQPLERTMPRLVELPAEPVAPPPARRLHQVPVQDEPRPAAPKPAAEKPAAPKPAAPPHVRGPRLFKLQGTLAFLVGMVAAAGLAGGVAGLVFGRSENVLGMIVATALVGIGQALALELDDSSISVGAVGAIVGAALFDVRAALPLAVISAVVDWSSRRSPLHRVLFNVGTLSLASLAAAGVLAVERAVQPGNLAVVAAAVVGSLAYYAVNMALLSVAMAVEGRERWLGVWRERFLWLLPHYAGYGFVGGVLAIACHALGLLALAVAIVPLLLIRRTQASYLAHTERSTKQLRHAAETIRNQNVSLERANRLLRERSTAAMESLSATVDARDAYTAGHSRRVQRLALAIGSELGLSQPELDLLGHAALFHDIGKLAVPDAVLLKPAALDRDEWRLMRRHSDEGARIIDRLGFLADAVPAIRHHHERFDGSGYPDGLYGEEIPLGARIIHVADALDSMLTTRIYRPALSEDRALAELRAGAGDQFCPRCVKALEHILGAEGSHSRIELLAS